MLYKIRANIVLARAVEIEADSLEEAKRLVFEEGACQGEWYDDEFEDVESYSYYVAELDEDGEFDSWEEVEEE